MDWWSIFAQCWAGEAHVGQHVGFGLVHQLGQFGGARAGLISDFTPLLASGGGIVMGKGGADPGGHDATLRLACVGQRVAHEMNPAALPRVALRISMIAASVLHAQRR